jgi:lysophospholipase L1-like esterase
VLRKFVKFCLWLLVIAIVCEIGLRFFGFGRQEIYVPDARMLWLPVAGHYLTVAGHKRETFNNQNFRYPVDLEHKDPSTYRIFTFGDSVTMGWGVSDEDTYSAVLERKLNAAGCDGLRFQVVDAGVNAYPNALVARRLKTVFDDGYQPDVVILAYSFNTEFENFARLEGANKQALERRVWVKSWVRRSALYDYVIEDLLRGFVYYNLRDKLVPGSWNVGIDRPIDLNYLRQGFEQSLQVAHDHNARLVMLLTGTKGQTANLNPAQNAFLEFATKYNVPLVNMIEEWKNQDQSKLYSEHVHPNAQGHEMIAGELYRTMLPLIPSCPGSTNSSAPASGPGGAAPAAGKTN